tara:strand:+ start:838 stop:1440 length:603 start_codon:yes stop_codon:yes gene_type:complete
LLDFFSINFKFVNLKRMIQRKKKLIFVSGGARSGKSSFVEEWAKKNGKNILFIATAQRSDEEMDERINNHIKNRPKTWKTLERKLNISESFNNSYKKYDTIILDCINLLSSNALLELPKNSTQIESDFAVMNQIDDIIKIYNNYSATWLIVTNEVGLGLVPSSKLGRLFRDSLGRANQKLANIADEVIFMVSGIPLYIKK